MIHRIFLSVAAVSIFFTTGWADSFTNTKGVTIEGDIVTADVKAGTVTLFVTKLRKEFELKIADLDDASQKKVQAWWDEKNPKPADWVQPGAKKIFTFPDLPKMAHNGETAQADVRIPPSYAPDKPVPLLVYLNGSLGNATADFMLQLDTEKQFVCVALPYPNPPLDDVKMINHLRDAGKGMEPFWEYQKAMLTAIFKEVPNIDPNIRAIGGFSNGAHSIGAYIDQIPEEFAANFNIYLMCEGGHSSFRPSKKLFADHYVMVMWGEEGPTRLPDCAKACDRAGMNTTTYAMEGVDHEFSEAGRKRAAEWFAECVQEIRSGGSAED